MHKSSARAFWMLFAATQLPALYPLSQLPHPLITVPLGLAAAAGTLCAILTPPAFLKRVLNTSVPAAALAFILALITFLAPAPHAPLTLPLWNILALLPLTPIALLFATATLRLTGHPWLQTNQILLALGTCTLLYTLTAQGSLLPAWSLLALATTLLLTRQRLRTAELAALIALVTLLSTAHPALILFPLILGFSLFAVWPRRAAHIMLWATAATALLTAPANPLAAALQQLTTILSGPELYPALAFLLIIAAQMAYHWRWWPPTLQTSWALAAPLFILSLASLAATASFPLWSGAILLIPPLALVTYTILRPNFKF